MTADGWLKCVWCGVHSQNWRHDRSVATCPCGARYSQTLLMEADEVEWRRILDRDGVRVDRNGDDVTVTYA
jgi:hypothetical protein